MERRRFVAALGTICATGLAGCGNDEPSDGDGTPDSSPTATGTPGSDDPADWETTYRSALEDEGFAVTHTDATETRLVVDYETETTEVGEFFAELETAATTYGEVTADSWTVEAAEIWVLDPEIEEAGEDAIASFLVQTEWAHEWRAGDLSTNAYMENVANTGERYEPYQERYGDATPTPDGGDGDGTPTGTETGDGTPTGTATASTPTDAAE